MNHPQTNALIATLKRQLKASGKTYQDVATLLELSEASIKRLFRDGEISLPRLEKICDAIDLEFTELIQQMSREQRQLSQLTREQEQQLIDDTPLLLVAICCINGYGYQDILDQYQLEPTLLIQKLAMLDRLHVIELLPNNRIKLRIAPNFNWLPGGPIQQFFHQRIKQEFFQASFAKSSDQLLVTNGLISTQSNGELQQRMQKLLNEFTDQCRKDASLPLDQRHGTTLVVAMRQWQSSLFSDYQR
ncbi:XRE family transcriptional regulator [Motiliproteus coralliicola]|uniref:XRE family transcriptional regulator n=1 Tax=Motiliproteus coralliicola TaxID=2283196 RepID=A0A369W8R0_9GAMM|nr:helix-turn-helix transcriptional regulator [Motiliproteus coralliicola]RDE18292.1 XRE family transcriptional regulator [Motiliproteus coralliicola]